MFWLLPIALSIVSAGCLLAAALSGRNAVWTAGVGAAVVAVLVAFAHITRGTDPSNAAWIVVLLGCGAIAGLHAAVWWRNTPAAFAAVACAVAAGALAITALGTDPDDEPLDPHPDAVFHMVALGDSYIAGEGAAHYFSGTDVPRRNGCRRAASAYPYLLADRLDAKLTFVACSGAETGEVLKVGQYPDSDPAVIGARPQLDELGDVREPDAVLLSIGGNDAGFGEIGAACAAPGSPDCRRSASYWIDRLDKQVFPRLVTTYGRVRAAARAAPVFAMTYPNPLGPRSCGDIQLSSAELSFLRDVFIPRLNDDVKLAARVAGIRVIDLEDAFAGRRICERRLADAAVNFIGLGRTRGTTVDLSLRGLVGLAHGTFHPNEIGHEMLAVKAGPHLEAARAGTLPPLPARRPQGTAPGPFAPAEVGPPVGPYPFPTGTACRGKRIGVTTLTSVPLRTRTLTVRDVRARSTVCFRGYRASWRSRRAAPDGTATVPIRAREAGLASINEILAESETGVWRKVVASRLGEPGETTKPREPSYAGFIVLATLLTVITGAAVWIRHRRLERREA